MKHTKQPTPSSQLEAHCEIFCGQYIKKTSSWWSLALVALFAGIICGYGVGVVVVVGAAAAAAGNVSARAPAGNTDIVEFTERSQKPSSQFLAIRQAKLTLHPSQMGWKWACLVGCKCVWAVRCKRWGAWYVLHGRVWRFLIRVDSQDDQTFFAISKKNKFAQIIHEYPVIVINIKDIQVTILL